MDLAERSRDMHWSSESRNQDFSIVGLLDLLGKPLEHLLPSLTNSRSRVLNDVFHLLRPVPHQSSTEGLVFDFSKSALRDIGEELCHTSDIGQELSKSVECSSFVTVPRGIRATA